MNARDERVLRSLREASMTGESLGQLVEQARALAGAGTCEASGHDWATIGGRTCPHQLRHLDDAAAGDDACASQDYRSQPVYMCARCGEFDYGEPGGPGWHDCQDCLQGRR